MAYSYAESTASGSTAVFTVPFGYIDRSYVHVSVNGAAVDDSLLTWNSSTEVVLPTTPAAGATVRRWRGTPKTPLVTFQSGDLSTTDLNLFATQCTHLVQEGTDTGDTVGAALTAISAALVGVQEATSAANDAAARAEAAASSPGLFDPATFAALAEMVAGKVSSTTEIRVAGGLSIEGVAGTEASPAGADLSTDRLIRLVLASNADTIAGADNTKPAHSAGVHAAIAAALSGFATIAPGTLAYWPAQTPPTGWLERDGSSISRTTYAALFAVLGTTYGAGDGSTTFNVPDDRGLFDRGWDHGRGYDSGRVFGSYQVDDFKNHTHTLGQGGNDSGSNVYGKSTGGTVSTSATGGVETRPKNRAYLPIIKY
jgi:microcystin-dependent protein